MKKTLLFLIGAILVGCTGSDEWESDCDRNTLVSEARFEDAPNDAVTINTLSIDGNCLTIDFTAGGCDGNSWLIALIDSGAILESDPPQRTLRLSLRNEELCTALVQRELSFDVTNLQVDGNEVQLNIANAEESVLYTY